MNTPGSGFPEWAAVIAAIAMLVADSLAQAPVQTSAKTWIAPASASRKKNPNPTDEKTIATGKQIFTVNCVACHGAKGDGDGPAAAALDRHPGVLSDPKMWNESDGALFWKVTEGNTPMPSFRDVLTPEQRWQLISYVRTLVPKPAGATAAVPGEKPVKKAGPTGTATVAKNPSEKSGAQTAAENEKLAEMEKDNLKLRAEVENLRASMQRNSDSAAAQYQETREAIDDLDRVLLETKKMAKESFPGTTKMLIGGYGTANFNEQQDDGKDLHKVFSAAFNPLLLWKISDRIFFEGEIELELEETNTTVNLEVAQVSYLLNDYMTLGAGRYLNPMNFFVERQHMGWVNKFPDKPLAVYDGLLAESLLGMQIRGGIPLGSMRFEYSLFVANPPTLNMTDSLAFGAVEFEDLDNVNNHVATGGRIGFVPVPHFEIGYGLEASQVGPEGREIHALMQSVDMTMAKESPAIKGLINVRAQWVWQKVDKVTFDPDGALALGPVTFDNNRNGGYASLSYRPELIKNDILKSLEPGVRFDYLSRRDTPGHFNEWRYAFGLDYWIYQNVVVKGAFELDSHHDGDREDQNVILGEFITGF
jgi:mono/diheme cytochrome c family protein